MGSGCDCSLLGGFKAFQTQLEVSNYALQQEDPEEARELEAVKQLRQLELAESKVCAPLLAGLTGVVLVTKRLFG